MTKRALIIGANSVIGAALSEELGRRGFDLIGTTRSAPSRSTEARFSTIMKCDFANSQSVEELVAALVKRETKWNLIVILPGQMKPIGNLTDSSWSRVEESIRVNLLSPLQVIQGLLPLASNAPNPATCIVFSGSGTNSAVRGLTPYSVSKVALTKAIENLDFETPDVRFVSIGPGWVKAPIHNQLLDSDGADLRSIEETQRRFSENDFVDLDLVTSFVSWVLGQPKEVIGGRNFSVPNDYPYLRRLSGWLKSNESAFKLRRHGNDYLKAEENR